MGDRIPRLALGTVQFGLPYGIANRSGQVPPVEAAAIVAAARHSGIRMVDTAIGYGDSENYLGSIGMTGLNVITKLPAMPEEINDVVVWVNREIDAALTRLKVTRLYAVLLHRPSDLLGTHGSDLYRALASQRTRGVTEKIGVSIYSPAELDSLAPRFTFDLVQAPFNLIDCRLASSGWLSRLKDKEVEVHTRSAFLQGLLLMQELPSTFARWQPLWGRWRAWLSQSGEDAVRACLAFPLAHREIDRVVVGVDSVSQFHEIIAAATRAPDMNLPDLACDDEGIANPSRWPTS